MIRDSYPISRIKQILEQLHGKKLFTMLDIRWGYSNIRINLEDRWKAAFKTPFGLYQPNVMFFGLMNLLATFQCCMDCIFRKLMNQYPGELFVYMDDILIATEDNLDRHQQIVYDVLELLDEESFFLKVTKCKFKQKSIDYLGITMTDGTIHIDPTKRKGLASWPQVLTTLKQLQSTLGVLGYQQPFIKGFTAIAKPLMDLLKKGAAFVWTPVHAGPRLTPVHHGVEPSVTPTRL